MWLITARIEMVNHLLLEQTCRKTHTSVKMKWPCSHLLGVKKFLIPSLLLLSLDLKKILIGKENMFKKFESQSYADKIVSQMKKYLLLDLLM